MIERNLTEEVRKKAVEEGADLVGIAPISRWEKAPERLRPQSHLPSARTVIVIGMHHPDASVEFAGEPTANDIGPFQIGMIEKGDTISYRLAYFLESRGYRAMPIPCTGYWRHREFKEIKTVHTAGFSHRHAAVAAGLGEFGWNNMFMSPRYGPRQRLISVITDAPLVPDPLYDGPPLCDRCNMCVKYCPSNSFKKELLPPGKDIVQIEGKSYEYAKLNRWRCIWSEQFALDVAKVPDHVDEDVILQSIESGVERRGWSVGYCLRFCMSEPVRRWDRSYSRAPRRIKEPSSLSLEERLAVLRHQAANCGADRWVIVPLKQLSSVKVKPGKNYPHGYPWEKVKELFPWVIALGRALPAGVERLNDFNKSVALRINTLRLLTGVMDLSRTLDDWGDEAMQMWDGINSLAGHALEDFASGEENVISRGLLVNSNLKELKESIDYVNR